MERLGLTEEELCAVLDVDPLMLLSGQLEHRPELPILLELIADPAERVGDAVLALWVRTPGPSGRPIEHLVARDFGAFEDALGALSERGFTLGRGRRRPAD